ncbi:MAG: ROK family protein [Solirubrobacterales bacterium]|nr:ROK family protein [Solirubrobacterales bacterium]
MRQVETVGLDLGGTKLATGVVAGKPEAVWSNQISSKGYSQLELVDLLADQINRAHSERPGVVAAGIGVPATIDFDRGHVVSTVNLDLEDLPLRDLVAEKVGLPVVIDNDANLAMLAEATFGAARGAANALLLTIGTGIGGGIWIDGKLYRGAGGAGAELGHIVVEIDGHRCQGNCPGLGCVEAMASGTAIGRHGREAAEKYPESLLGKMAAEGDRIEGPQVAEAARQGDAAALEVVDLTGHYLGNALVSLANIFQPEVIVLGGGVIALGEHLLEPTRKVVRERALKPMNETPVVAAELGPAAGMIGAAELGRLAWEGAVS